MEDLVIVLLSPNFIYSPCKYVILSFTLILESHKHYLNLDERFIHMHLVVPEESSF